MGHIEDRTRIEVIEQKAEELLEEFLISKEEDDYFIINPLGDNRAVVVGQEEDEDGIRQEYGEVRENVFVLARDNKWVDIFNIFKDEQEEYEDIELEDIIKNIGEEMGKLSEKFGIDIKKDEFSIYQPLAETQCVELSVYNDVDGERKTKVSVSDTVVVLDD